MNKILQVIFLFNLTLYGNDVLSEVQKHGLIITDEDGKKVKIDRETNLLCTKDNINPNALFGGDLAGKEVASVCKKTFVTKVGVLQPMHLGKNIQTVGELEVLAHIKNAQKNPDAFVLIDARTQKWFEQMSIPTSVNLAFNEINYEEDKEEDEFSSKEAYETYIRQYKKMFKLLNIEMTKEGLDFSRAKTLVLFCNGSWCSQSPNAIFKLINMGYPKEKLLWYRGGLQDWLIYDFTVKKGQ